MEKIPHKMEQNYDDDDDDDDDDVKGIEFENEKVIDSSGKDDKDTFYHFLEDHPLYHSHHVMLLKDIQGWVPNFVGGAFPRSNCGDKEFYCSTMLAFFKPWGTGKDLKSKDENCF